MKIVIELYPDSRDVELLRQIFGSPDPPATNGKPRNPQKEAEENGDVHKFCEHGGLACPDVEVVEETSEAIPEEAPQNITETVVRQRLRDGLNTVGAAELKKLLSKFDAPNVSAIRPEDYGKLLAALDEMMESNRGN